MEDSNRSANPGFDEVSSPERRVVLRGGLGAAIGTLLAPLAGCATPERTAAALGFRSVPVGVADAVVVPEGYAVQAIAAWGEAVGVPAGSPPFRFDAGNTAAEQEVQTGMHHDGIHFYPLPGGDGNAGGLLVMNHEYADDGLLHPDGMKTWSAEKVRKAQAAHGVSVIQVERQGDAWRVVRPSRFARRITARTPIAVGGPAAGHALLRTAADPDGRRILGTLANCASGITPWGTYLTCEENFAYYFKGPDAPSAHEQRWGLRKGDPAGNRWHEHDERFDATKHPNEPNRFGWVVEIDPFDHAGTPVKRTALGRAAQRGRHCGDDQGRPGGRLHGRGRALRVPLQVRQPRSGPARRCEGERRAARPRHAVRRPLQSRRQRPLAAAAPWQGAAHGEARLRRPG
jgi:secreted PhoX family phosphatase